MLKFFKIWDPKWKVKKIHRRSNWIHQNRVRLVKFFADVKTLDIGKSFMEGVQCFLPISFLKSFIRFQFRLSDISRKFWYNLTNKEGLSFHCLSTFCRQNHMFQSSAKFWKLNLAIVIRLLDVVLTSCICIEHFPIIQFTIFQHLH